MAEQTLKKSKAVGRVSNGLGQTVENKFVQGFEFLHLTNSSTKLYIVCGGKNLPHLCFFL